MVLDLAPVLTARRGDGRFHDPEIFGAVAIGQDDELIAVVIYVVFVARQARE